MANGTNCLVPRRATNHLAFRRSSNSRPRSNRSAAPCCSSPRPLAARTRRLTRRRHLESGLLTDDVSSSRARPPELWRLGVGHALVRQSSLLGVRADELRHQQPSHDPDLVGADSLDTCAQPVDLTVTLRVVGRPNRPRATRGRRLDVTPHVGSPRSGGSWSRRAGSIRRVINVTPCARNSFNSTSSGASRPRRRQEGREFRT